MNVIVVQLECGHRTAAVEWPGHDPRRGSRRCPHCDQPRKVVSEVARPAVADAVLRKVAEHLGGRE